MDEGQVRGQVGSQVGGQEGKPCRRPVTARSAVRKEGDGSHVGGQVSRVRRRGRPVAARSVVRKEGDGSHVRGQRGGGRQVVEGRSPALFHAALPTLKYDDDENVFPLADAVTTNCA